MPKKTLASDDDKYRLLVDSIIDYAIIMLDAQGHVATWNEGAHRSKGYAEEEILGEHFSRFYTPEDRAAGLPAKALAAAASAGRYESEGWRVRKEGTLFWAHVLMDPVRNSDGALVGFAKITRDLTERRKSADALQNSERQFKLLVGGVTDYAIYMLDPKGFVSSWNPGAERIKGYKPEEIIGKHFSTFYTTEDLREGLPEKGLAEAMRTGRFEKEGWRVRKDGTRFMAHVVIDAIRDDAGKTIGFAKITRDITERVLAQESLMKSQQALFQTQKLESLGQLTGGIAHDFNNLLAAVMGSLELLRRVIAGNDRAMVLVENAIQGSERGILLTQRLLAFARRQELQTIAFDLGTLVSGMMALVERTIGPAVSFTVRIPSSLPAVRGDPNQLEAALLNLIINSRDAMPAGGAITIEASLASPQDISSVALPEGAFVCISVIDTGEGMSEATALRATEPFFTTKGVGKGTGLGLSMVQGLAEQLGGKMTIRSTLGHGTRVMIWLPMAREPIQIPEHANTPAANSYRQLERSARILLVDDDDLVLRSTKAILEELGYAVTAAPRGSYALEALRSEPPFDVLFTDQAMPGMSGVELIQIARSLHPRLSVVLASGFADLPAPLPHSIVRLTKPYRIAELSQAVSRATSG